MSKKLYAALLPVLAVVAFASMSAAAQAAPHWYLCEKVAAGTGKFTEAGCKTAGTGNFEKKKVGTTAVAVTTKGTLTLKALGLTVKCTVKDKGTVVNPAGEGAGQDSITEFVNEDCTGCPTEPTSVTVAASATKPIATELEEVEESKVKVVRDKLKALEVTVVCPELTDLFTGELLPKFGAGTGTGTSASFFEFGTGSGELKDSSGNKATVEGKDFVEGPSGAVVLVSNP
jgi:hypothetical protein